MSLAPENFRSIADKIEQLMNEAEKMENDPDSDKTDRKSLDDLLSSPAGAKKLADQIDKNKLVSVLKLDTHEGDDLWMSIQNLSKDTLTLDNVLPFEKLANNTYITGKGDHSLSRTHLFLPGKMPVNVIVPDNAWELGFNTLSLNAKVSIYGFSRRDKQSLKEGKIKRWYH